MNMEHMLLAGGDSRLLLDPATHTNRYGCTPLPQPDLHSFSSSTARTISQRALQAVEQALYSPEEIRQSLTELLGIEADIILSPSGTDSTLHAVFLARALMGVPLESIVLAPNESGSGVPFVAAGLHPDTQTARGMSVVKGEPITQLATGLTLQTLQASDDILETVSRSIEAGKRVLLHMMDNSKLGYTHPSPACLQALQSQYGDSVLILVDACQGRTPRSRLHEYLRQGCMVSITGSKFFTGPPFSGALLVPPPLAIRIKNITDVPTGLADYTEASAWPPSWPGIRSALPDALNIGLCTRWTAALYEMRAYYAVPTEFRKQVVQAFADTVLPILKHCPHIQLLPLPQASTPTIFPFFIRHQDRYLSFEACKQLYSLLIAQRFQLGQPVLVGDAGVLRISSDARLVYDHWEKAQTNLEDEALQITAALDKIASLLRQFDSGEWLEGQSG